MQATPKEVVPSTPVTVQAAPHKGPTAEAILYVLLFLLAMVTRFTLLGAMALHHDEGIHARFGWDIYTGAGWTHDAVYHGPVIYHAEALGFYLFGDSDATTRVTLAISSIATVMLPFFLRRQLGRWGALLASFLFLISPTFLYFGRFGHPDVFGSFFTLLCFVCIVRYLEDQRVGWLYGVAVATCLHFSSKPTAYIVTAIFLLYLAGRLLWERYDLHALWPLVGLVPAAGEMLWKALAKDAFPFKQVSLGPLSLTPFTLAPLLMAVLALLGMLAWRWYEAWHKKRPSPLLDLIVVLGTMVLPLLSAIPLNLLIRLRKMEPLDYHSPDIAPEVVVLAVVAISTMFLLAAAIGLLWNARRWGIVAALFWGIFFVLHTSFFSSMTGWATGLVQALGFWLTQQDVKRIYVGPQYIVMLMSAYEAVVLLFGAIGTVYFAWKGLWGGAARARSQPIEEAAAPAPPVSPSMAPLRAGPGVAMGLLAFWTPAAFLAYSLAGEQVPWLNLHPTLPFVLMAAAFLGRVVSYRPRQVPAEALRRWADRVLLVLAAALLVWAGRPIFAQLGASPGDWRTSPLLKVIAWLVSAAVLAALAYLAFARREKHPDDSHFLVFGAVALAMAAIGANTLSFGKVYDDWRSLYIPLGLVLIAAVVRVVLLGKTGLRSVALLVFAFLSVYGVASAIRLTYINNDTPVEMLVYVQSGSDVQWAMDEMYTLSTLTTGGKGLVLLYDDLVAWPFEWYLRNFTQKVYQATIAGPPPEAAAVAFVYRDKDGTSKPYLESRFYPVRYYIFNWWFPEETYRTAQAFVEKVAPETVAERLGMSPAAVLAALQGGNTLSGLAAERNIALNLNLGDVARALLSSPGQARAWRWLAFREILSPLGAREFAFYVRRDLVGPLELLQDSIPRR